MELIHYSGLIRFTHIPSPLRDCFVNPPRRVSSQRQEALWFEETRQSGAKWDAVAFNQTWPERLNLPDASSYPLIDMVYIPEINNFNGRSTMQFRLLDLRPSE